MPGARSTGTHSKKALGGLPQAWEPRTELFCLKEEPGCVILWGNRIFAPDKSIVDNLQRRALSPDLPGKILPEKSILLATIGDVNGRGIKLLRYQSAPSLKSIQQLMGHI
jgi:hypothetical protein